MFGFGKKKPGSEPGGNQPAAQPQPPAAAQPTTTSDADMFGGMQARTRRKKATEEPEAPAAPPPKVEPVEPPKAEEPKPFFSSFNFAANAKPLDMTAYEEDPETARIRRRLERFYAHYNPGKLATLDNTLKSYSGRETELFEALVKKYGPEPKESSNKQDTTKSSSSVPTRKRGDDTLSVDSFSATSNTTGGNATFGNDFAAADAGFGEGFTAPAAATFGDGGFDAPATFGDAAFDAPATFGDAGFGSGFENTGDGFTTAFGADSQTTGFGVSDQTGFGEAQTFEGPTAFSFLAAKETTDQTGFGFATVETVPPSSNTVLPDPFQQPGIVDPSKDTSDESDEGGRYGVLERQDELISIARHKVSDARSEGSQALISVAERCRQRRRLISEYSRLEGELDRLTAAEEYEAADAVNTQLNQIAKQIDALDAAPTADLERSLRRGVSQSLENLASEYQSQRSVLQENRAEEERRTTNYIAESRTKLDQVADAVRADLEKASRLLRNTEQEVENLAQRRKKIEDKISDQTKELRAEREKVAAQASKLEEDIKELEKALAAKRRLLTERRVTLQDMDHQLNLVTDSQRESMQAITAQETEEAARLKEAIQRVDALTASQNANNRASQELQEETDVMMHSLEEQRYKIRRFEQNVSVIQNSLLSNFNSFYASVVGKVLEKRSAGAACLSASPHRADSSGGNQVATLLAKINGIENEIKAALDSATRETTRAQELTNLIPSLETAKKAAAAAKQFKEAAAKTEEIKRATEDRASALAEAESMRAKIAGLEQNARALRKEKDVEAAAYRARIRTFTDDYASVLRAALTTVDAASSATVGGLDFLDGLPLFDKADLAEQATDDRTSEDDVLIGASRQYIMSLFEELAGVLDVPLSSLLVEPEDVKPASQTSRQASQSLNFGGGEIAAETGFEADSTAGFQFDEPTAFSADADAVAQADGGFSGFGVESNEEDPYADTSLEDLKFQLTEQLAAQESALAQEDYDLCEKLQTTITALENAIAAREMA